MPRSPTPRSPLALALGAVSLLLLALATVHLGDDSARLPDASQVLAYPLLTAARADASVVRTVAPEELASLLAGAAPQRELCREYWPGRYTPLCRHVDFYEVRAEGRRCWVSPQILITPSTSPAAVLSTELLSLDTGGSSALALYPTPSRFAVPLIQAGLALWLGALLPALFAHARSPWLLLVAILGLRLVLLGLHLLQQGDYLVYSNDESGYFQTTRALLGGTWPTDNHYLIGHGVYYVPFALATGARDVFDLLEPASLFGAIVLESLAVLLVFVLTRGLAQSAARTTAAACSVAVWAALAAAALPFFYLVGRMGTPGAGPSALAAVFALPFFLQNHLALWGMAELAGFSALSDLPAAVLSLLALHLIVRRWPTTTRTRAFALGALLGIAFLVRVATVLLFAPLALALLWELRESTTRALVVRRAALVACGFVLCVIPQLVTSYLQFGSPWTLPYVEHEKASRGFELASFVNGAQFFLTIHFALFAFALPGIWLASRSRAGLLLATFFVVHLCFYCGYVDFQNNAVRFLLPVLLLAPVFIAITARELCTLGRQGKAVAVLWLAAALAFHYPALPAPDITRLAADLAPMADALTPLPAAATWIHLAVSLALLAGLLRRKPRLPLLLLSAQLAIFHSQSWQLLLAAYLFCATALLLRAALTRPSPEPILTPSVGSETSSPSGRGAVW